jgi:hypothetical protein
MMKLERGDRLELGSTSVSRPASSSARAALSAALAGRSALGASRRLRPGCRLHRLVAAPSAHVVALRGQRWDEVVRDRAAPARGEVVAVGRREPRYWPRRSPREARSPPATHLAPVRRALGLGDRNAAHLPARRRRLRARLRAGQRRRHQMLAAQAKGLAAGLVNSPSSSAPRSCSPSLPPPHPGTSAQRVLDGFHAALAVPPAGAVLGALALPGAAAQRP